MNQTLYSAFLGNRLWATGTLSDLQKAPSPPATAGPLLVFAHDTGEQFDLPWPPGPERPVAKPGPGRPKLGVTSAEITLLPRHWDWLNAQPARASGTLRRLVEDAMAREAADPKRRREALGRVLWAVAGNEADFEEAMRALYSGDTVRLHELTAAWPGDLPSLVRNWQ